MAFISANIISKTMGMGTAIRVIIPEAPTNTDQPRKILYLLHGLSDDCTTWSRRTSIERYADERNYAVVMPEVQKSFYTDMVYGPKYFTYVTQELPKICENLFGFRHKHETTFVAGLSMGGYGALKCGLSRPGFFGGMASFSGAIEAHLHIDTTNAERMGWYPDMAAIAGVGGKIGANGDVYKLAQKAAASAAKTGKQPKILITCGTEDFLIDENRRAEKFFKDINDFDFLYLEWEGKHEWGFWDKSVQLALKFFDGESVRL